MIIEVPEFVKAPESLRAFALSQAFTDFDAPDGECYKRVAIQDIPEVREALLEMFPQAEILGMGFRLNFNDELPNQAVHSDLGWGTHALVLYLSEGPGGTAFWRHIATDTVGINSGEGELLHRIQTDWDNEDAWELRYLCKGAFGKAVIYPGHYYHSRYPFKAYGNAPETGRLVAVAFFNL